MISQSRRRALSTGLSLTVISLIGLGSPSMAQTKLEAADRNNLEMGNIVMPVARNGALVSYILVTFSVRMNSVEDADFVRQQHFLVKDAVTRQTSRNPIPAGNGHKTYDAGAVSRAIATAISSIKPGLRVLKVQVTHVEFMRG